MKKILLIASLSLSFIVHTIQAQDPKRFQGEVDKIIARDANIAHSDLIVFAGSSSFRMWNSLQEDFSDRHVVNHGFGGSETSDLIFYVDELITRYNPKQIFIYEGDNDLNAGKDVKRVLADADKLVDAIRAKVPATVEIVYVTPKPSPSRWALKKKYQQFNRKLKKWAKREENVKVLDVWPAMLGENGEPKPELFIEDKLHMNKDGYAIWTKIFRSYFK
ncbi:SGNH/GDSL hydrolase family protein [Pseudochryseolinea flava]|uniref:G-D-S-L family lipolytic protein n=1 Tax=Pseudochryseolinea flava TaxID=2059302 RepID=A0A364Y5Q6_9BACT|nr:SGNH/GDSL hydrolase family protein [Pseudochryseolinea flava]RAW01391.1 G-D-S-L family lipolytic protein [Pseudochryseolinea flava]